MTRQNIVPQAQYESRQYMLKEDFEVSYYKTKKPEPIPLHQHNFYEVLFFRQGHVTYHINGIAYEMLPCDILLIPPDVLHQPVFTEIYQYKRMRLWISKAFMDDIDPDGTLRQAFYFHDSDGKPVYLLRKNTSRIFTMFETLISEDAAGKPMLQQRAGAQIFRLLFMLNGGFDMNRGNISEEKRPQYEIVIRAATYINEHIEADLSLDNLADQLFVSKFYLSRLFKQYMHITCHQYITEHRMIAARRLINEGYPMGEVYKRCGYSNYATFYRAFVKVYGSSPRAWGEEENGSLTGISTEPPQRE